MDIYLARHGQNEDNEAGILNGHRDRPLTSRGVAQAEEAAAHIQARTLTISAVYTSPLIRAARTAAIIADRNGFSDPVCEPLLIERDFGVMAGRAADEIEELCAPHILKTETVTYFLAAEGAETFPALLERAETLLQKLTAAHAPDESLLLVTHGDIGKMIYAQYYGLPWKAVLQQFHFGNSELIHLSPDSPASQAHLFEIDQHGTH